MAVAFPTLFCCLLTTEFLFHHCLKKYIRVLKIPKYPLVCLRRREKKRFNKNTRRSRENAVALTYLKNNNSKQVKHTSHSRHCTHEGNRRSGVGAASLGCCSSQQLKLNHHCTHTHVICTTHFAPHTMCYTYGMHTPRTPRRSSRPRDLV